MGGKLKGNQFENLICKKLSLFLSNQKHVDLFQRSSNSGGRQTVLERNGVTLRNQAGDISLNHSDGEEFLNIFCMECKHYRDIGLWSVVTESKGNTIYGWWTTHLKKCEQVDRRPILVTRQNNRPILFFVDEETKDVFNTVYSILPRITVCGSCSYIHGYLFDDLLMWDSTKMNCVYDRLRKS